MAVAKVAVELSTGAAVAAAKKLQASVKKLESAVDKLNASAKSVGKAFKDVADKGKKGIDSLITKVKSASKNMGGLTKAALAAAAAAGAAAFVNFAFGKAGELERQTKSLEVLTGSLEEAQAVIKELQAFGAVTPFTSEELIETAKQLKAFGFETEQLTDVTKRLADVAGATGADLGGIATAFGQIQAKGKLQTEELLQLQERGVGLGEELKEMYGLTGEEFSKALEKGQISAEAANVALNRLTEAGGKYADGAIAQSDTLFGKLSTLQDAFDQFGRNIGKVLEPIFKSILDFLTVITNSINNLFREAEIARQVNKEFGLDGTGSKRQFRGGSVADRQELFDQIEARKQELRDAAAEAPIVVNLEVPALLPGRSGSGTGGKSEAEREAEKEAKRIEDIAKASADRVVALEEQTFLASALNEEERIQFERQLQIAAIMDQQNGLSDDQRKAELAATTALFEQQDVTANLLKQQEDRKTAAEELAEAEAKAAEELNAVYQQIGDTISSGVVDALKGAVDGTTSLADAATKMLDGLIDQMLTLATNMLIFGNMGGTFTSGSGLLGGLFGGFFADGGRPPVGQPSIVGERGPELFVPDTSGTIVPNGQFGMGGSTNIVVNVDAKGTSAEGPGRGKELGTAIGAAVQAELIKQKRPGGLLS